MPSHEGKKGRRITVYIGFHEKRVQLDVMQLVSVSIGGKRGNELHYFFFMVFLSSEACFSWKAMRDWSPWISMKPALAFWSYVEPSS